MGRHSDSSEEEPVVGSSEDESSEEERIRKSKKHSSHKKKKSKDKKKHKRKSSKKHRRRSSSSEEDSTGEEEWVTKPQPVVEKGVEADSDEIAFKKPKLDSQTPVVASTSKVSSEQDANEWIGFGDALSSSTFSNESKRTERRKQKEKDREANSIDKLGQHVNELNPYWKDGGTGLPEEESESKPKETPSQMIGDGGLNYLRKAFIRAKEQAKEEGRGLEEVMSERWGSLERFLEMLEEAENKAKGRERERTDRKSERDDERDRSKRFIRPSRDSDDEDDHRSSRHYSSRSHRSDRDRDRDRHRDRDRRRSRDRDRDSGWRKKRSPSPPNRTTRDRRRSPEEKISKRANPEPCAADLKHLVTQSQKLRLEKESMQQASSPEPEPVKEVPKVLTDKEMNELGAKLLKAEMLGNDSLAAELKVKISEAEKARQDFIKNGGDPSKAQTSSTKVVTKVVMDNPRDRGRRNKDKISETHKDGQRVRYFPDDDRQTLQNMFQREKMNTAADENALFARLAGKGAKTGQDYDIDDVFTDKASSSKQSSKEQEKEIRDVLDKEKHYKKVLDHCPWCFDGNVIEKHLILSMGEKSYLCAPPYQSMTEGHCLIVPMTHVSCSTELDEDVWAEMQKFRKALVRMFRESDQDMVIFETALFLKRHPHMYLECIPMPKETGELAPIYFKKAIQECETEWSQNKKLVDLRNRDVRRAVPKGLPYFSVDFGDDSCGFAHVVEDEQAFPRNFAHEIVGGMMELDHHLWRKQKKDDFKTQRNKVMEFLKTWAPHDWTRDPN